MDDLEYIETQKSIEYVEAMVAELDLAAFLDRASRAQTLGPFVDPTLYRLAMGNLQHIENVARKLRELQAITLIWRSGHG